MNNRTRSTTRTTAALTGALLLLGCAGATTGAANATTTATTRTAAAHPGAQPPVSLPDGFRPEGVTSGPGDTYYTGSLADGRIWTGDLSRGTGRRLTAGVQGRALRGMQYDHRTGLLWVTGGDGGNNATGIVLTVNARTGKVTDRIVVPGAAFLNDLVITRKAVWVTDSGVDKLTRVPLDRHGRPAGAISQVALTDPWPTPAGNRANGIRALSDGSLIVDNSTAGGLWRLDPKTGTTTQIPVTGVPAGSPGITGGDGLELRGSTLYVVRGSGQQEVSVLTLRRSHGAWSARWQGTLTSSGLDVPSTATLVGRTLWAVNARFGVAAPDAASYTITPLPVGRR